MQLAGVYARASALFAFTVLVFLILAETPFRVALIATGMIFSQTVAGMALCNSRDRDRKFDLTSSVALGFASGTAISLSSALLLRPLLPAPVGWFIPIILILAYYFRQRFGEDEKKFEFKMVGFEWWVVGTVTFLYLAQDSHWPTRLCIAGALIGLAYKSTLGNRLSRMLTWFLVVPLSAYLLFAALTDRAPYWWYLSDDFRMFESLSRSVWNYGPNNPLGTLATIGAQYHFSTYAFSGLLDVFSNAPHFVSLNKVLLVVSALSTSLIVVAFLKRGNRSISVPTALLAACYPLFFDYSFTSPSYCFGLFFFLVTVYFWTDLDLVISTYVRITLNVLLTAMMITSKVSNLPVALVGLSCLVLYSIVKNRQTTTILIVNFVSSLGVSAVYFFLFLANSRSSTQIKSLYPFGYAQRIAGDLVTIDGFLPRVTASLIYTSIYLVLPILGTLVFLVKTRANIDPMAVFSIPAIPIVAIAALFGGHDMSGYFVLSGLGVLNVSLLIFLSYEFEKVGRITRSVLPWIAFGVCAAIISLFAHEMRGNFNGGTASEIVIRSLLDATWIPALVLSVVWLFVFGKSRWALQSFWTGLIFSSLVCLITVEVINLDRMTKGSEITLDQSEVVYGTPEQVDVGLWLNANTSRDDIMATNHFCGEACSGASWFSNDISKLDSTLNFPSSATGYGGFNFWLSLYSERRFFVEGSRFLLMNGMSRDVLLSRMNASLSFANEPSETVLQSLVSSGVSHFVVDKQSTTLRDWGNFASKLFENKTFIVLQLHDQNS